MKKLCNFCKYVPIYLVHLKVLPIDALGKYIFTKVTKFFHIDSIGTQQQSNKEISTVFSQGFLTLVNNLKVKSTYL